MPVYAIIPIGIASANWLQVGASPQITFSCSVSGLRIRTKPSTTSSTCVEKSITESVMLSPADSFTPTTLIATRRTMTPAPTMMSQGFVRSGSQKIDR
jgi:hypothetical protein